MRLFPARSTRWLAVALAASLWLLPAPSALAADPLQARVESLKSLWQADSKLAELFAPGFLAKVPEERLRQLASDLERRYGPCTGVRLVKLTPPDAATLEWTFARGYHAPGTIAIQADEPHGITGLWIGPAETDQLTWQSLIGQLRELPGTITFGAFRLPAKGAPECLASEAGTQSMAIGSAFKLYLLGELVAQIEAGKRHWTDVVTLRAATRSLPSGLLQDWPDGAPMTLYALAGLMISRSDNTATDTLLSLLGRDRLPARLAAMGNASVAKNTPFLSTADMFRLKGDPAGRAATTYLGLKATDRAPYLEHTLGAIPLERIDFPSQPSHIDSLEWFASAEDLARAMQWLWTHTERGEAAKARELLAINPGLPGFRDAFSYVGFKGGSEPGVLNLTYLLRTRQGGWYVVSASWNDPTAPVEEHRLYDLLSGVMPLLKDR